MKTKLPIIIIVFLLFPLIVFPKENLAVIASIQSDKNSSLIIYTYDSLLADPGYAFDREFEKYAGLDNFSVKIILLDDAGSIVTKAIAEKNSPVADVLIGIDNILVEKARQNDILIPYEPINSSNIRFGLVDALANDFLLTPYDFGVISLWYLVDKIESNFSPETFVLSDLLDPNLSKLTIVENPLLSSPGLGFLLWTITILGDKKLGITGIIDDDWEDYWKQLSDNIRIVNSWGDALSLMYAEESNRPIMVSYTTSPAYGSCLYNDTSTKSFLSHENNKQWGWQQVEGIGLVKNAPHPDLAKKFINWFISEEVQNQIYLNQWMYPAINGIATPQCYSNTIDPDAISSLNNQITRKILSDNIDDWLNRWELAIVEGSEDNFLNLSSYALIGIFFIVPIVQVSRKKRIRNEL